MTLPYVSHETILSQITLNADKQNQSLQSAIDRLKAGQAVQDKKYLTEKAAEPLTGQTNSSVLNGKVSSLP